MKKKNFGIFTNVCTFCSFKISSACQLPLCKSRLNSFNISPAEVALSVDNVMAELESQLNAKLNRQGKTAINKLKKLPLLNEVFSKSAGQKRPFFVVFASS